MRFRFTQVLPLLVLVHALMAFAQRNSAVSGFVLDPTGAAIPGATLRIQQSAGPVSMQTQSGPKGEFSFTSLPAGDHSLVIPAYSGFAARMLPLHLQASLSDLNVTLVPQSVSQAITVGNDASTLTTDSAANRDTVAISGDQMRDLPVFDQDYVAALMPFLDASSGASGSLILVVDGVEMKCVGVSPSAIQEVRINNDPYSTEFNRPGRGRIEITSKPGSSDFHGEANFIFRDAIFNAKYFPALVRPPEARQIYEGHFTGPIGHGGHTNFIASTSVRQRNTAVVVDASTPNGQVNENILTPNRNAQVALRVTHDFSPSHRLQVGYNFEYGTNVNTGVGGIVLPEAGYDTAYREDDLIFNDRIILSPSRAISR